MITQDTINHLQGLYNQQDTYRPNDRIVAQLAQKNLLIFVGPTCAGKNTIMNAVAKLDGRFRARPRFTSRDPRPDDEGYYYYESSDDGLRPLFDAIERREVVQYAVNTFSHTIYGSNVQDYTAEFNMADVYASNVGQALQLGFKDTFVFSIAVDAETWQQRFEQRFPAGHPQRRARLEEAVESLEWSLARTEPWHHWLINNNGNPDDTARQVIAVATGGSAEQDTTTARGVAQTTLEAIRAALS